MKSKISLSLAAALAVLGSSAAFAVEPDALGAAVEAAQAAVAAAPKPLYPQVMICEAADWSKASAVGAPVRSEGKPDMGFTRGGPSLVLLTKTAAYYYHEDCDICAELTKCDLATGKLTSAIAAHMVGCSDMKTYRSEPGVVYDSCAESR